MVRADGGLRAWGMTASEGAPAALVAAREHRYGRMGKAPFEQIGAGSVADGAKHWGRAQINERMSVASGHAWD